MARMRWTSRTWVMSSCRLSFGAWKRVELVPLRARWSGQAAESVSHLENRVCDIHISPDLGFMETPDLSSFLFLSGAGQWGPLVCREYTIGTRRFVRPRSQS